MARTKDPHAAAIKSWATRRAAQQGGGSDASASRTDWLRSAPSLAERLQKEGGFTYSVISKRSPKEGFVVSAHPEREQVMDASKLRPDMLRQYVKENRDLLTKPGNYLGGWLDGDKVYLDVSTVVESKQEAVRLGKEHDQIGVYDIKAGETVIVKSKGAEDG